MSELLRILDANLNRAREGLRTAEEYARLGMEDAAAAVAIRDCRRLVGELSRADPALERALLDARDVAQDPGARPEAASRGSMEDVARAGIKRAQEALRVVEEVGKVVSPVWATQAAAARYLAYSAEQQLFAAAPRRRILRDSAVMVVFTRAMCRDWQQTLEALLAAEARLFQLREKEATAHDLHEFATQVRGMAAGALILVNDRADVARAANADGVHVGQSDLTVDAARAAMGPARLVGVSTHNPAEARDAARAGADYVGLGAMFPTASKNVQSYASAACVREVTGAATVPVFCIGGVAPDNVATLREMGVMQVAAGASILKAPDPAGAYRALVGELTS